MKKSSLILLGYGLGYIIIAILTVSKNISLTPKDLLPLSIASFIFALAEFCDSGGKLLILSFRQLVFHIFASIAFKRFENFKKYVEKKYFKKRNEFYFNLKLYSYWVPKRIANYFSRKIQRQYERQHCTSIISLFLYIIAAISLVVLLAIVPYDIVKTSDSFNNSIQLIPLGLMFINVFLESESSYLSSIFFKNVDKEVERLKKATDEYKELFNVPQNTPQN